jgi:hypothetical protein
VGEGELTTSATEAKSPQRNDLANWKQEIANQFGVTPRQVKILVEL